VIPEESTHADTFTDTTFSFSHGLRKRAVVAEVRQRSVDRAAYLVCVLEQFYRSLNRRDVFASPSHRWPDPRESTWRSRCGA